MQGPTSRSPRSLRSATFVLSVLAGLVLLPEPARAFTGVFLVEDDRLTQVREHRVAIAMLRDKTVRWDEVQWSGNPTTLALVTPMRRGSSFAVASGAWFASLDGSTQPVVFQPPDFGPATGCAIGVRGAAFLGGCSSDYAYGAGPTSIQVTRRAVVGPSEIVTLTSKDAVVRWLDDNRFTTVDAQTAALEAYEREGFDFVAMRLFPKCGQNTTRPIRVTTSETGDAARLLPTRLMPIGASLTMPLTLYVIAPERFAVAGATNVSIPIDELTWDDDERRSNYDELRERAVRSSASGAWLTEYARTIDRSSSSSSSPGVASTPSLFELYPGVCGRQTLPPNVSLSTPSASSSSCPPNGPAQDGGSDARSTPDASRDDAGDDDAGDDDDGGDAGTEDAGLDAAIDDAGDEPDDAGARPDASSFPTPEADSCAVPDDLTIAVEGLELDRVFLTRLQSNVFSGVLAERDLRLVPSPGAGVVTNNLQAVSFEDDRRQYPNRSSACESSVWIRSRPLAPPAIAALVATIAMLRRRSRQRRP